MRSCHLQLLLLLLLPLLFLLSLYSVSTTHAANNNNTTVEVVLFRPQQSILTLDPITYVDIHGNVIVSDESCTYFFFELSGPEGEVSLKAYYDLPWNATTDEDDDHPHGKLSIYTMVGNYTYENHTGNSTVIESEENADNTRRPSSVRGYQLRSVDIINIPRRQQSIQSFAAILNFQHSIPNAIKTRYSVGVCSNDPLEPNGTPFEISLEFYCGGSTYTSSSYDGDFICQLCPQHSRRLDPFSRFLTTSHGANSTGAPNYSAKDCICEDGYYLNTNISNDTCLECPQGSLCSGTTNAPIIAAGYYPYIVDEAFDSDTSTHMIARDHNTSTVLVKCPYPEACIGEADTRSSSSSSSSSQKNGVSDSSSSSSSVCAAGYTGFVCNTCDDDHFRLGQKCRRCDEKAARPVRFVFYLIAILLFWSLIYPLSSFYTYIGSPSILINFIQITALFAGFNLDWPTYLLDIFSFMSLANWNIEVTGPECMTKGFTFYVRYAFMLAIPVLYASMAALNLLIVALVNLLVRVIEKKRKTKGTGATCGALCGQVPRLFHIKSFAQWTNSAMVTFVLISWVFVSQWSLEFFSCDIFPSSVARVTGIPSVHTRDSSMVCQRGLFSRWSVFASIAMIIYVVILPILLAAFVITIFIIRKKSGRSLAGECPPDVKISDLSPALNETRAGWIYLYGPLYARFKPKYFWWETVITFRKLGIVVCAAYLLREPAFGALLSSTVLIICATAHIVIMPYKHMSSNVLEAILLFLQIAMIICGVCFYAADFDAYDTVLATFVILFVSLGFLIGVGVLIFELVRYWGTEKIIVEECETNQILLNSEPRVHESRLTKDTTIPAASPPRGAPSAPPASEISLAPPPPPPPLSISTPPPPPAMPLSNNCAGGLPPPPPPPPQGLKPDYALYRPSYEY